MSLLLTLVAAFFVAYAMYTFHVRRQAIRRREDAGLNQVPMICKTLVLLCTLAIIVQRCCPTQVPPILVASSQHLHIRTHTHSRTQMPVHESGGRADPYSFLARAFSHRGTRHQCVANGCDPAEAAGGAA